MTEFTSLAIRKLADKSDGVRIAQYDRTTGERYIAKPEDPDTPCPWPLAGIKVDNPPEYTRLSTSIVQLGKAEGWLRLEDTQVVHRPGGPPSDEWRVTHTFEHARQIIIDTVDGEIIYEVTRQPDKYVRANLELVNEEKSLYQATIDPEAPVTPDHYESGQTEVLKDYELKLVGATHV